MSDNDLQDWVRHLHKYEDADKQQADVNGARAVFKYNVYTLKGRKRRKSDSKAYDCFILLSDATHDDLTRRVREYLKQWARKKGKDCWTILSDNLTLHLNLPIRKFPEGSGSNFIQVLCLAEGLTPFVLAVLYDKRPESTQHSRQELEKQARHFTRKTARVLMSTVMNFCCVDFFLLSGVLWDSDIALNNECLQKELDEHLRQVREFYGGPDVLSETSFADLKQAVMCVMRSSVVPYCLQLPADKRHEKWLLLFDESSQAAVSKVIDCLIACKGKSPLGPAQKHRLTYRAGEGTIVKIVCMEAVRRISLERNVYIVCRDSRIKECVTKINHLMLEDHGLTSSLISIEPEQLTPALTTTSEAIVIAIDVPDCENPLIDMTLHEEDTKALLHADHSLSLHSGPNIDQGIHMLLVGKSGSGKSATGNTIFGEKRFPSRNRLWASKSKLQTESGFVDEIPITVTEVSESLVSAADWDAYHVSMSEGKPHDVLPATCHAVCYVIPIGERFSDEDVKTFERFMTVLGGDPHRLLPHLVLVFTGGDKLFDDDVSDAPGPAEDITTSTFQDRLQRSPDRLKEIVGSCQERVVIFDNQKRGSGPQVRKLLDIIGELRRTQSSHPCPSQAEVVQLRLKSFQAEIETKEANQKHHR